MKRKNITTFLTIMNIYNITNPLQNTEIIIPVIIMNQKFGVYLPYLMKPCTLTTQVPGWIFTKKRLPWIWPLPRLHSSLPVEVQRGLEVVTCVATRTTTLRCHFLRKSFAQNWVKQKIYIFKNEIYIHTMLIISFNWTSDMNEIK